MGFLPTSTSRNHQLRLSLVSRTVGAVRLGTDNNGSVFGVFCFWEAFQGFHLKAGTDMDAGLAERMLTPPSERQHHAKRLGAEVSNPSNIAERRWIKRGALLIGAGLLVILLPLAIDVLT